MNLVNNKIKSLISKVFKMNKIQRYIWYIKQFIKSKNKIPLLLDIKNIISVHGVKNGIKLFLGEKNFNAINQQYERTLIKNNSEVIILTTPHCLFVANLIKYHLELVNIQASIIFSTPISGFKNHLHYVICPQMFPELPKLFIAFQMEQTINPRWMTSNYYKELKSALCVLDYSLTNIEYFLNGILSLQQMYYMPVYFFNNYLKYLGLQVLSQKYDVVFYGDINNVRRTNYINEIAKIFKIKVVSNVFGHGLVNELLKAKVIINIHYYANALLETTRIYECLSLNKLIISECSSDQGNHVELEDIVDFVKIGDISSMLQRVKYWLGDDNLRKDKIASNKDKLQQRSNKFLYFFYRFMLAYDLVTYEKFYSIVKHQIHFNNNFLCLSLPESIQRRQEFNKDNNFSIQIFEGLRHSIGWVGCGLSFKAIINKAKDLNLDYIIVCEDDVEFYSDFNDRLTIVLEYLVKNMNRWDIFSGLIANLNDNVNVLKIDHYKGEDFIYIDKIVSTVCNIYNVSVFDVILKWDNQDHNSATNTIDRYLESSGKIKCITLNPFLVGHKEKCQSTLWGFQNTQYRNMITDSCNLLTSKVNSFKLSSNAHHITIE